MPNKNRKIIFENIVLYSIIGMLISLIIFLSIPNKLSYSNEDSRNVVLSELKVSIYSSCDDACLHKLNNSLVKEDSVYEVNFEVDDGFSIVYDGNELTQNDLISFINIPISIISDEKVIMKCPEKCAYCDAEKGVCKSFS